MDTFDFIELVLAVGGLVLAYVFYRRAEKSKEPCWAVWTTNVITDVRSLDRHYGVKDLRVLYRGQDVTSLSISMVVIWNRGRDAIHHDEVAKQNPLRVTVAESDRVIEAQVMKSTRPAMEVTATVTEDERAVLLGFEYLNYQDGCVVRVVHLGPSSRTISVRGDVRNSRKLKRATNAVPRRITFFERDFMWSYATVTSLLTLFTAALILFGDVPFRALLPVAIGYFLVVLFFSVAQWSIIRNTLPRGLEVFD